MDIVAKKQLIAKIALFKDFDDQLLQIIAQRATYLKLNTGEIVTEQEDNDTSAYLICTGSVKIYRISEEGALINLAILGEGEIIGELSLLDGLPRSATAEAIQDTSLLKILREDLLHILDFHPKISIHLLQYLSRKLRKANETLEIITAHNIIDRTLNILQKLSPLYLNNEITLSQEQLAEIVGATRARVTEALNKLQSQNKVSLNHRRIKLL